MAPPRWLTPYLTRWLTSEKRLAAARKRAAKMRKGERVFTYFHRVDDPYSHLMVQALLALRPVLEGRIEPHVVERLPADMYPDPARYEAMTILDAERLANRYGLLMPTSNLVPDRLSVQMVSRYLAGIADGDAFLAEAFKLGTALWSRDQSTIHNSCSVAEMDDSAIRASEGTLASMGYYQSGLLVYEGEPYQSVDRLYHLTDRLRDEGIYCPDQSLARRTDWRAQLDKAGSLSGRRFDFFFSVRSPYSFLAVKEVQDFAAQTGAIATWRPVLPMMMRGMYVPPQKGRFILMDTAREARAAGISFGCVSDPLGEPTERAMSLGLAITDTAAQIRFFDRYMTLVWAEGRAAHKDTTFDAALTAAGVDAHPSPLTDAEWRKIADTNLQDMLQRGSWGVPSFSAGRKILWGQDRLWALPDALVSEDQYLE